MQWKTIRLELAGTRDFPTGSVSRGYLVKLPLTPAGAIDEATLARNPQRATVRRFWSTEPDESGRVVRADGHLALRCEGRPDRLLSSLSFGPGERVVVLEGDQALPFRVAGVG